MTSLKDAAAVTAQLDELAGQLHAEVTEGRMDFGRVARLADEVGELADAIAGAFIAIDEAVTQRLEEPRGEAAAGAKTRRPRADRDKAADSGASAKRERDDASSQLEELTRDDLLERARELDIAGRSTMAKEELVSAIESEGQVSKEELLDRAREAGIPGRSK